MKPADRQKMCPNCDGRIPHEATQCPYCFATMQVDAARNQTLQDSLTSLYSPPYSSKAGTLFANEEKQASPRESMIAPAAVLEKDEGEENKSFWPILFLSLAGNLFVLGVLQFFFSEEGMVKLEINGSYWFLFILLSLPLFFFGWKKANQV